MGWVPAAVTEDGSYLDQLAGEGEEEEQKEQDGFRHEGGIRGDIIYKYQNVMKNRCDICIVNNLSELINYENIMYQ